MGNRYKENSDPENSHLDDFPPDNSHLEKPNQEKLPPRITPTWNIPTQDNSHLENSHLG